MFSRRTAIEPDANRALTRNKPGLASDRHGNGDRSARRKIWTQMTPGRWCCRCLVCAERNLGIFYEFWALPTPAFPPRRARRYRASPSETVLLLTANLARQSTGPFGRWP
jgi:hypothetical protein